MSAVSFATTAESASSMTLAFSRNPSFPQSVSVADEGGIAYRSADNTPYMEITGRSADVALVWPADGPMAEDDYLDLQTFARYVRGTQDQFTYTDAGGEDHAAYLLGGWADGVEVAHGFAVTLVLRIRS